MYLFRFSILSSYQCLCYLSFRTNTRIQNLPRYMWRKVHTLSCKSLAFISWAGGCIEKSYRFKWWAKHLQSIKLACTYWGSTLTRGGKIFSAALRGTEKPPWVLVSLAVNVLQKNSVCGLCAFSERSDLNNASLSNWRKENKQITHIRNQAFNFFVQLLLHDSLISL